jgi:hypothetical protein
MNTSTEQNWLCVDPDIHSGHREIEFGTEMGLTASHAHSLASLFNEIHCNEQQARNFLIGKLSAGDLAVRGPYYFQ